MQICADCKWGVLKYVKEYKGIVIGCQSPNEDKVFSSKHCFVPKEQESADNKGKD